MASLEDIAESDLVKMMLIGDSGSGKTGSLLSLVEAGYKLRVVDLDDGLTPLAQLIKAKDRALLKNVEFVSHRDEYKPTANGMELKMPALAYKKATETMNKWSDGTSPAEWGKGYIYVVDSFTMLGKAAYNAAISASPNTKDPRQWFYAAQSAVENYLACVMGPNFGTNVIVISHVTEIEMANGIVRGFPSAVGKALSRHIAKVVNDLFVVEVIGTGANVRRKIRTVPDGSTDAKTSVLGLAPSLPIETGLADIFKALQGKL